MFIDYALYFALTFIPFPFILQYRMSYTSLTKCMYSKYCHDVFMGYKICVRNEY